MGNRFQDQELDMKENVKAIEENGRHLVLSPRCLWLLVFPHS